MFFPPKLTTILFYSVLIGLAFAGPLTAQQSEFNRRLAAMQQARSRALQQNQPVTQAATQPPAAAPRVAQAGHAAPTAQRQPVTRAAGQAPPTRTVQAAYQQAVHGRVAQGSGSRFVPQHLRSAPLATETIIDGGSPIVESPIVHGEPIIDGGYTEIIDDGIIEEGGTGFCADGSCGQPGGFFDGQCCGRGGCAPGNCWITGLGTVLQNAEYFGGATAFRSPLFSVGTSGQLFHNDNSGFFGGFNLGFPLCRLTCGALSGQVGVRSVQTNFNGNFGTTDNRDQLFITAGVYRRVDYGFQVGVVADILHEEWFTESDTVQIRGDLAWVYPSGSTFGFRFANNVQDDVVSGTFAGIPFTDLVIASEDSYRFYYRRESPAGGYRELFLGWSENDQTIVGLDFDLPLRERVGLQAGFFYYLDNDGVPAGAGVIGGNADEAFNISVGLVFRPRGRAANSSYDRPLLPVADNGTFLVTRQ